MMRFLITLLLTSLPLFAVTQPSVGTREVVLANGGTATNATLNGEINPLSPTYAAGGQDLTDDTTALQAAMAAAAGGRFKAPGHLTFKITGPLYPASNTIYDWSGSTIHAVGNFRAIYSTNIHDTTIRNLNVTHGSGSTGQASFHTTNCYNLLLEQLTSTSPALNSFETYASSNVVLRLSRSQSPTWFGIFHHNSTDCVIEDCSVDSAGSFSVEPKSSKRMRYTRVRITNPLAEHAFTSWTGFSTGPDVPGPKLNENIVIEDLYVKGSATGHHLLDINATRNVIIRGGVLEMNSGASWAPFNISSTFFYNEGTTMTGDATSGGTNIVNVTAANQLMAGSRIHLAGSATNHTIYSVVGTTVALTSNSDITGTGVLLGFVAVPGNISVSGLRIVGAGSAGTDNILIGGTAGDPLDNITFNNVVNESAPRFGMSASYATIYMNDGSSRNATGLREINASTGSRIYLNGTQFSSATNLLSYAYVGQNGAYLYALNTYVANMGIGAFISTTHGDNMDIIGGSCSNIMTAPIILWDNSSVVGMTFTNNLIGLGSFNADVRLEGTNNTVAHNHFFLGAAASTHDSYIKEQSTNATVNAFIGNTFEPSLTTFDNVALSAGSTSIRVSVPDTRFNAITATSITNTTLTASQFVGTDANKKLITITNPILDVGYSSAWNGDGTNAPSRNSVYDKIETLVAAAAGTNSVLINGSIVTNPNLQDGTKSFWSVTSVTNVVNVATNITANQITDATITYAKVQNISATKRVLGRNTAGAGVSEEVTLSQLLDWTGSAAQGDVLYRGAATWALLPAGTNGQVLATQGAAANPHWIDQSASGAALVGTMINTGASVSGAIPNYTDTTGTNFAPSNVVISQDRVLLANSTPYSDITIASDAIGETSPQIGFLAAESGTSDNLSTINVSGGSAIRAREFTFFAKAGHTITIKNGTGNIITTTGRDVVLDGNSHTYVKIVYWGPTQYVCFVPQVPTVFQSKSANYTATAADEVILCDTTSGAFTVDLPAASTVTGKRMYFKKISTDTSNLILDPSGTELIEGASTFTLNQSRESVIIQCDGTAWYVVSKDNQSTFTSALVLFSSSAPTTSTAGALAFDNNAWAASHGAVQSFDGTANVYAISALASDTPSAGQVPKFNANGTITWENDNGTADNWLPSGGTDSSLAGTGFANALVITNSLTIQGGSSAGTIMLYDSVGSGGGKGVRMTAPTTQSTNINFILPDRPSIGGSGGQGLMVVTVTAVTNLTTSITNTLAGIETALGSVNIIDQTEIDTSLKIKNIVTDETGSGALVFGTGPTLTDVILAGTFKLTTGTSPTTSSAGQLAFDSDAWAANRGAVQVFDGTANTYLIGVLTSDTPSNGQVPKFNSATGTITWENDDGSSASISDIAFAATWDTVSTVAPSKNAVYDQLHLFDKDDDGKIDTLDIASAIVKTDSSGNVTNAVAETDYVTPTGSGSLSNKTIDYASNVIKTRKFIKLSRPDRVDGAGCTYPNTNDFTTATFMRAQFSGTAATNANYARFAFRVPKDWDTSVDPKLSLTIQLAGADTTKGGTYHVGLYDAANSASADGTAGTWITHLIPADTFGASGDVESTNDTTLTGWSAAVTANHWMVVELRRNGVADAGTAHYILELEIEYQSTQ